MAFVSVTRLRLRALYLFPAFALHTVRSTRQLRSAAGYMAGRVVGSGARTFWTITLWESEAAMRAYRNSGAHMRAMPKLIGWCDEAAVAHWEQRGAELPIVADAARRLGEVGRLSRVREPSAGHRAGRTWPDGVVPTREGSIAPNTPAE